MVRIIKPYILCILVIFAITAVPCDNIFAQGTTSFKAKSPYLPDGDTPTVHGMGVTSLSSYFPDSSYQEAYQRSVEDLRANLMTSVYLESFKTTLLSRNTEFAIRDSIDTSRIIKLDSTAHNGFAYFFTSIDSLAPPHPAISGIRSGTWTASTFSPVQQGHYWIAAGKEDFSQYAPYESWAKSKLDALSQLSRTLQTTVQSSISGYNSYLQELTYITSKTIFRNVLVLDRTLKGDTCYTLVAVDQDEITYLD